VKLILGLTYTVTDDRLTKVLWRAFDSKCVNGHNGRNRHIRRTDSQVCINPFHFKLNRLEARDLKIIFHAPFFESDLEFTTNPLWRLETKIVDGEEQLHFMPTERHRQLFPQNESGNLTTGTEIFAMESCKRLMEAAAAAGNTNSSTEQLPAINQRIEPAQSTGDTNSPMPTKSSDAAPVKRKFSSDSESSSSENDRESVSDDTEEAESEFSPKRPRTPDHVVDPRTVTTSTTTTSSLIPPSYTISSYTTMPAALVNVVKTEPLTSSSGSQIPNSSLLTANILAPSNPTDRAASEEAANTLAALSYQAVSPSGKCSPSEFAVKPTDQKPVLTHPAQSSSTGHASMLGGHVSTGSAQNVATNHQVAGGPHSGSSAAQYAREADSQLKMRRSIFLRQLMQQGVAYVNSPIFAQYPNVVPQFTPIMYQPLTTPIMSHVLPHH
jgi:hypothetical protein